MRKFVLYIWASLIPGPLLYAFAFRVNADVASFGKYAVAGSLTNWIHGIFPSVSLSVETAVILVQAANLFSIMLLSFLWQAATLYCLWSFFAFLMVQAGLKIDSAKAKPSQEEVIEGFRQMQQEHGRRHEVSSQPELSVVSRIGPPPKETQRERRARERREREERKQDLISLRQKRALVKQLILEDDRDRAKVNHFFPRSEAVEERITTLQTAIGELEKKLFPDQRVRSVA